MLYQYLDVDDINDLDAMLNYFTNTTDMLLYDTLNGYRNSTIVQRSTLATFEYNKDQIEKYIKVQKKLKSRLKKLK